jgi:hypothetical protein
MLDSPCCCKALCIESVRLMQCANLDVIHRVSLDKCGISVERITIVSKDGPISMQIKISPWSLDLRPNWTVKPRSAIYPPKMSSCEAIPRTNTT